MSADFYQAGYGEKLFPSVEAIEKTQPRRGEHGQGSPVGRVVWPQRRTGLAKRSPQGGVWSKKSGSNGVHLRLCFGGCFFVFNSVFSA